MQLLIKNATIVNATNTEVADILINGHLIDRIAQNLDIPADTQVKVVDASNMLAFPGGIDPHVHMSLPTNAGYSSDNFYTGSRAALMGGTTTIIDFVTPQKGMSLQEAITNRLDEARDCLTDFSFHVSPVEWRDSIPDEIQSCIQDGISSFKLYMAYKDAIGVDDETLEGVMRSVALNNGLVTLHCETGDEVDALRDAFAGDGNLSPAFHPLSRPAQTESNAVKKAISLAGKTRCPIYVVHTSAASSITHIRDARQKGQTVMAEVCPQHLLLDESLYNHSFEQSAPYVLSPPLRSSANRAALWGALAEGVLQTVATDHCPFFMHQKEAGRNDFRKIPNGAGGVEHRIALLYTHGVKSGHISTQQFVDLIATKPAEIFGLYPQKGIIKEGSDADIVLWDPNARREITAATHHQNSDINIYEGIETIGHPQMVIAKGEIVVENDVLIATPKGEFLRRKTFR